MTHPTPTHKGTAIMEDEKRTEIETCADCKFNDEGQCHRFPPVFRETMLPTSFQSGPGQTTSMTGFPSHWHFPKCSTAVWCGEYKAKDSTDGRVRRFPHTEVGEEDMLTVKHEERGGHESIVSAKTVEFDPATGTDNEFPHGQVTAFGVELAVSPETAQGAGYNRYSSGIIYVMNDHGSTIAKYDLG